MGFESGTQTTRYFPVKTENRLSKRPELTKLSKPQGENAGHKLNYLLAFSVAFSFLIFLMHKIYSQEILYQSETVGSSNSIKVLHRRKSKSSRN